MAKLSEISIKTNPQTGQGDLFTKGNNPWIDGITYNAQWGTDSPLSRTDLNIKLLDPADVKAFDLDSDRFIWYKMAQEGWEQADPIGQISPTHIEAIKKGYKSWTDVANIKVEFVDKPSQSDVMVTLANYKNGGVIPGVGTLQGSHRGLLSKSVTLQYKTGGGESAHLPWRTTEIEGNEYLGLPSVSEADFTIGYKAIPSPTPLLLDLNFATFKNPSDGFGDGSNFLETIIHEVGHGIGMSHPHDMGLGSVPSGIFPGIQNGDRFAKSGTGLYGLNQNVYTIMSYNRNVAGAGEAETVHAMTPMALETLAAQIKYGQNKKTNAGKTIYNLNDRTDANKKAWECIWDVGGKDTITAQGSKHDVIINLRPAEMNTSRPETGEPHEEYGWGEWSNWQRALDFLINAESSGPGTLLGSGVKQAFNTSYYLDNIISRKEAINIKQDLDSLSDSLKLLYQQYDFNRALPLVLVDLEAPNNKKGIQSAVDEARTAYQKFTEAPWLDLNEEIMDKLAQKPSKKNSYIQELTDTVQRQSTIQDRSARGVAGHISQISPQAIQDLSSENRPGGGFTIAAGVTIENAIGGRGNDVITGNYANNLLIGRGGDDLIKPYSGNNRIRGGAGKNTVDLDNGIQTFSIDDYAFETQRGWDIVTNSLTGDTNRLRRIETIIIDGEEYSLSTLL